MEIDDRCQAIDNKDRGQIFINDKYVARGMIMSMPE